MDEEIKQANEVYQECFSEMPPYPQVPIGAKKTIEAAIKLIRLQRKYIEELKKTINTEGGV